MAQSEGGTSISISCNTFLNLSLSWFQDNLKNNESKICREYLKKRNLKESTIQFFKLGYSYNKNNSLYNYLKNKSFSDEELIKSNVVKLDKNKKIKDYFYKRLIFPIMDVRKMDVLCAGEDGEGDPNYWFLRNTMDDQRNEFEENHLSTIS